MSEVTHSSADTQVAALQQELAELEQRYEDLYWDSEQTIEHLRNQVAGGQMWAGLACAALQVAGPWAVVWPNGRVHSLHPTEDAAQATAAVPHHAPAGWLQLPGCVRLFGSIDDRRVALRVIQLVSNDLEVPGCWG